MAYQDSKAAKAAGWFSRRHESKDEHDNAQGEHKSLRQRQYEAEVRAQMREERTDEEQLRRLYARGCTSGREVERLKKRIFEKTGWAVS